MAAYPSMNNSKGRRLEEIVVVVILIVIIRGVGVPVRAIGSLVGGVIVIVVVIVIAKIYVIQKQFFRGL